MKSGVITKRVGEKGGQSWGTSNKLAVHTTSGIGIDFFAANKSSFLTLLVCRTGSMESNTRVASAAIKMDQTWNMYRGFEDRVTGDRSPAPSLRRGKTGQNNFMVVRLPADTRK